MLKLPLPNIMIHSSVAVQGLEQYGIGKWREISENLLPRWDDQNLRVKASRLMGSQSLARYIGWQGSRWALAGML